MRLSIIIPIFNAGDTVENTIHSIVEQLTSDAEVVIVDDGSTDATPEILSRFAQNAGNSIRLIRQDNAGAAAARNTAIANAKGDYLAFVDADDRFCENAIDTILKAVENDADIVGWDWQNVDGGKVRRFRQADYSDAEGALRNLMGGTMKWNLWLFAVRHKLVVNNGICFLPGSDMGEDMSFMLRAYTCAANVSQIHEVLYEYNAANPTSISRQLSPERQEEVSRNLQVAEEFLMTSPYKDLCKEYLPYLKLYIKRPLLISSSKDDYRQWYNWFPEANTFASKKKDLPLWTLALQWFASKRMWNSVKLYNLLYNKVLRWKNQ